MNFLKVVKERGGEFVSDNSTTLLTAGGVVGTVVTAVLAGRAGFKLGTVNAEKRVDILDEMLQAGASDEEIAAVTVPKKDLIIAAVPELIPPFVTGTLTITAIIMSHRMSAQKAAAMAAAYGILDRQFGDYKEKVTEKLTGQKQTAIKDEMAQDAVDKTPGHDRLVIVEGEVLCFDKSAGRYFNSTVERLRQAANTTNAEVNARGFAPVSFFYDELDLPGMEWADAVGFGPDNLLELDISTTLAGSRPCVTFSFGKPPKPEYGDPKNY